MYLQVKPAQATIVSVSVVAILAFVCALGFRDGCANPNYATYGNVSDCPARK